MQSKCSVYGIKNSRFVNEEEAEGLLRNLGIKTSLNKIPFQVIFCFNRIKMNEIVNTLLLAGDKSMPEMHLKQPGFSYSASGPFTKNK